MKILIVLFSLLAATNYVQGQTGLLGIWEGKLKAGADLQVVFHFSQNDSGRLMASMDIPDQGLKNIKVTSMKSSDDSVWIEIGQFQAKYSGKISGDSLITGTFQQGVRLPLNFKKVDHIAEKIRPQTPQPPYPYIVEDLVYDNKDKSISYGATITIPEGKGPFPAVLLLTGSGQQNRDEEIMGHKPFAVIADHLTRNGLIVLRVDDRGMGNTTGDLLSATTLDFANDAVVSLEFLKKRKEVDQQKIGLIGHSEGGMIAQMIAAKRNDIDFIVLLAAPGENIMKVMTDQNEAFYSKAGLSKTNIATYLELYKNILKTISDTINTDLKSKIKTVVDAWIAKTPANVVVATTGIRDEATKVLFVDQFVNQLGHPWFKYFLAYDPAVNIKKIQAKVLALNGSNDIQVISKSNLAAIESALKNGRSKKYEVKEFAGLNHLFQECKTCTTNEYNQLEQTISPVVLEYMSTWIRKVLKP
jgi:pimeloyl-ACP methyl ester carboxylesterase